MTTLTYTQKHLALAKHLEVKELDNIVMENESLYIYNNTTFLVYTDQEATEACYKYIEENLWCFDAKFILEFSNFPSTFEIYISKACEDLCEDANDLAKQLLGSRLEEFCQYVISCDGRGPFLASYDGEERECDGFFIYKN